MTLKTHTLSNGNTVQLAEWEDLAPPQHGTRLQAAQWDPEASRAGLSFYPATDEHMRNTWAQEHMHPTAVQVNGKNALLFYNQSSGSWHTSDALDIDHKVQWKDHLQQLSDRGPLNQADAQMGYNDASNLRLLPAAINRARDSAEEALKNGPDSPEGAQWCRQRFGFDASHPPPPFDPEKDLARRHASSYATPWADDNTRADLAFDKSVREKWFQSELHNSFQGEATLRRPVHPFDEMKVPMFACAASGQLCTRDAFDIDHQVAFETLLKELPKYTASGTPSMGEVRDAYNETSNLRLVSRSANASHEWELTARGEFRDAEKETPLRPGELDRLIAPRQAPAQLSADEQRVLRETLQEVREMERHKMQTHQQLEQSGVLAFRDPRDAQGPVVQLNQLQHPDHPRFQLAMQAIDRLDPEHRTLPEQAHRDNLAASLVVAMRRDQLPGVDVIDKGGNEGQLLFAVYRPGQPDERYTHVGVTQGAMTPMAYSTFENDRLCYQSVQAAQQQAAQHQVAPAQEAPQQAMQTLDGAEEAVKRQRVG